MVRWYDTGVDVHLVSKPFAKPIQVALSEDIKEEIPDRPQQVTNHDEGNMESVDASDR